MNEVTYADFLRLPALLAGVVPSTPRGNRRVHAAEHFFLVAHQSSELWLKQVLLDLTEAAVAAAPERDIEQAAQYVDRAAEVVRLLAAHVAAFRLLQPRDFADFRPAFGDASGAQSAQFHRLSRELGLYDHPNPPLYRELLAAVAEQGTNLETIYRQAPHSGSLYRLAESMAGLSQAVWHWQLDHVETATRMIGRVSGTGGTSGVDYLAGRLATPFPELWAARSGLHQTDGGMQCPL